MQATASVSYSSLLRYKITKQRCSLQLNTINKGLEKNMKLWHIYLQIASAGNVLLTFE